MTAKSSTRISKRGIATREQIVQAGVRLFTERGYHRTTVQDLFDDSGITKGAFFHHWKTKEDFALSIFDEVRRFFDQQIFSVSRGPGRARDQIEEVLHFIGDSRMGNEACYARLFALLCIELNPNDDRLGAAVHQLKSRWYILWKDLIGRAQAEHDLRADIAPESLSFLVMSSICGVQLTGGNSSGRDVKSGLQALRRAMLT